MKQHNCTEVLSKVSLALDGELTEEQERELMEDVNRCSSCLEKYNIERSFKAFLCNKICKKEVSPDLVQNIRSKIDALKSDSPLPPIS